MHSACSEFTETETGRRMVRLYATREKLLLHVATGRFEAMLDFLEASNGETQPTQEIDSAWHFFILNTREYAAYCKERFGTFIHHVPTEETCFDYSEQPKTSVKRTCDRAV